MPGTLNAIKREFQVERRVDGAVSKQSVDVFDRAKTRMQKSVSIA
jgi:hypothetical protein